jgi:hypothetical protein
MYSCEIEGLLKKAKIVISHVIRASEEGFGEVFGVV